MARKEDIVADLKELLESDTTRTKMGRIWEIFDEIVELQRVGISMKAIEVKLNQRGFDLKPGNLTSYLSQIRKKKGIERKVATKKDMELKKAKHGNAPALPDTGKPAGAAVTPKKLLAVDKTPSSADVKRALTGKNDFSRYDDN